jgi:hypothetical protein
VCATASTFYVSVRNEESRRAGAGILEDPFKRYVEDVRDAADDFERRRVLIAFDTIEARRQAGAHLAPHISVLRYGMSESAQ